MTSSLQPAPHEHSVQAVKAQLATLPVLALPSQPVGIQEALGRVLAEPLTSPMAVPSAATSAMDGYAFAASALMDGETTLPIIGRSLAGHPWPHAVATGACVRIMTGALVPEGCDTVIPQEHCRATEQMLVIPAGTAIRAGQHCRAVGEDLALGAPVLPAGRVIRSTDIALLASLGFAQVPVRRRLRVAFFSTGDELRALGTPLLPGQIYDSNRYALAALLQRVGADLLDLGVVPDDPAAIEAALQRASAEADAILTSGGVSVGDADFTRPMMARLGQIDFCSIAMRPGRPFAFGRLWPHLAPAAARQGPGVALFALPGNPVAVVVSFLVLVREALWHLQGATAPQVPLVRAQMACAVRKRPGRMEYLRVRLTQEGAEWVATPAGHQGAAALAGLSAADGLAVLGEAQGDVAAGDVVHVLPFEGLI